MLCLLSSCMTQREVMRHYQRGGVLPYGNNKKLMKYEKNYVRDKVSIWR